MSDWYQIENEFLTIQVITKGAEMKRFYNRIYLEELLWTGEEKIWNRSAPVLFPIVGKLVKDQFRFQEKAYTLAQHGFARDMEFQCVKAEVHECEFAINANQTTFAQYPFLFELKVNYLLIGPRVNITYTVNNKDRQDIYFSIGAHPGFDTMNINDFNIQFEKSEDHYYLTTNGLLDKSKKINFKTNQLDLSEELFQNGALVFPKPRSTFIDLQNRVTNRSIRLSGIRVPFLGIWGKDHVPFVCLEPWHGVADLVSHNQELQEKLGIIKLPENEKFTFTYSMEVLNS